MPDAVQDEDRMHMAAATRGDLVLENSPPDVPNRTTLYHNPYFVQKKFNVHMYTLTQSQRREGTRVAVLAIRRSVRLR